MPSLLVSAGISGGRSKSGPSRRSPSVGCRSKVSVNQKKEFYKLVSVCL